MTSLPKDNRGKNYPCKEAKCFEPPLFTEERKAIPGEGGLYCNPRPAAAVLTMLRPITSEAVAAGEGTLSTCNILPEGTN